MPLKRYLLQKYINPVFDKGKQLVLSLRIVLGGVTGSATLKMIFYQ